MVHTWSTLDGIPDLHIGLLTLMIIFTWISTAFYLALSSTILSLLFLMNGKVVRSCGADIFQDVIAFSWIAFLHYSDFLLKVVINFTHVKGIFHEQSIECLRQKYMTKSCFTRSGVAKENVILKEPNYISNWKQWEVFGDNLCFFFKICKIVFNTCITHVFVVTVVKRMTNQIFILKWWKNFGSFHPIIEYNYLMTNQSHSGIQWQLKFL